MCRDGPPPAPTSGFWRRAIGLDTTGDPAPPAPEGLATWIGEPLVDEYRGLPAGDDPRSRWQRLTQVRQVETLDALAASGTPAMLMKGVVAAHLHYALPWRRTIGDIDLLTAPDSVTEVLRALAELGFRFEQLEVPPWGFRSDASYMPLVSADGLVSIDLHHRPDERPLGDRLDAREVLARSRGVRIGGHDWRVPCPEHAVLIAISNLAKERFDAYSVRTLVDVARLALRSPVDWPQVRDIAADAGLTPALATLAECLRAIEVPGERLPVVTVAAWRRFAARRIADGLRRGPMTELGRAARIWREVSACYAAGPALRLMGRRLAGLLAPRAGLPPDRAGT